MENHAPPVSASPEYVLVAECLYRNSASSIYYGLLKRGGKQIRRSLKTTDRKLAERRLAELREKVSRISATGGCAPDILPSGRALVECLERAFEACR